MAAPKELEDFVISRIDDLFYDVNTFSNEISKQASIMMGNGMSQAQISSVLNNQLTNKTGPFGQLERNTKSKVTETVNQSSRKGQESQYSGKDKFAWVSVAGHKVCGDCDGRAGQVMTYEQWEGEGLPGTGWSVCKGYCYCVLDPTGKIGKSVRVDTKQIKPEPKAKPIPFFKKMTQKVARALVKKEMAKAALIERKISKDVLTIGKKHGAKNKGFKNYRLKGSGSATRKVLKENLENGWGPKTIVSEDLKDLVRYTYIIDDAKYVDDVAGIFASFEERGYILKDVRNYWNGVEYKGLNTCFVEPTTGRFIEIQFNTASSQFIKDRYSHKLYDQIREVGISASQKRMLSQKLQFHWTSVTPPPGWKKIKNVKSQVAYPPGWNLLD